MRQIVGYEFAENVPKEFNSQRYFLRGLLQVDWANKVGDQTVQSAESDISN